MRKPTPKILPGELLIALVVATACLACGCGHKRTLAGDEYSAHSDLLACKRIAITNVHQSFYDKIEQTMAEHLPAAEIVAISDPMKASAIRLGRTPETINPDRLTAFGKKFHVDALVLCRRESKPMDASFGKNYYGHRLTLSIVDTETGKLIGYGSGILSDPFGYYPGKVTINALSEKVVDGIFRAAISGKAAEGP